MSARIVRETVGSEEYEYIPLGKYVVSAPAVCRGRPTFKYTRIEVAGVLELLGTGRTLNEIVTGYQGRVSREAVEEATRLAAKALARQGGRIGAR
jgi:uncharacterized protein (DUF433 family)